MNQPLRYLEKPGTILLVMVVLRVGNSGPLDDIVSKEIIQNNLNVCSVISGNRNFEGRIHSHIKSNFLASPPLVIIYAIAGRIDIDLSKEPITIHKGKEVFLKDLWPSKFEVENKIKMC